MKRKILDIIEEVTLNYLGKKLEYKNNLHNYIREDYLTLNDCYTKASEEKRLVYNNIIDMKSELLYKLNRFCKLIDVYSGITSYEVHKFCYSICFTTSGRIFLIRITAKHVYYAIY